MAKIVIDTKITGQAKVKALANDIKKVSTQSLLASKSLDRLKASAARASGAFAALGTTLKVGVVAGLGAATFGVGKFIKDTFSAGDQVESLQNRFQLLFGSVEEGGKAFDSLAAFAAKVPFSLEEIAAGSGNLAVISKDAAELTKIMEITGNVAAATGLDFQQTATQIQRSFAGGIASADIFRERGVRAMLGFEAGAKVSVEETRKRFFEVFGPGGTFGSATKLLANTLTGQVSMVQDKYFQFRSIVAKSFFGPLKKQIADLNAELGGNQALFQAYGELIGERLGAAFRSLEGFIRGVIENFDKLVFATKIYIGLKVVRVINGTISAFALLFVSKTKDVAVTNAQTAATARATIATTKFTKVVRVLNFVLGTNPVAIFIRGLVALGAAIGIANLDFGKLIKTIKDKFSSAIAFATKYLYKFKIALGGSDAELKKWNKEVLKANITLNQNAHGVDRLAMKYQTLTKSVEQYRAKQERIAKYKQPSPQREMAAEAQKVIEANKKRIEQMNVMADLSNRNFIRKSASDKTAFNEETTRQVKEYRKQLESVGIESRAIGQVLGTTWVDGIRQGNSFLEITKNSFKNILVSISETFVKKSAELLVEQLFIRYADQKIIKQRQLNGEIQNQSTFMQDIIGKSKNILGGIGGIAKGIGGLFSGFSGGTTKPGTSGGWKQSLFSFGSSFLKFSEGGLVPGGAPYTDRIPAMLTPGETVIPRDKSKSNLMGSTNITNINISGNVDQRAIEQIRAVIATSQAEVGGANRSYSANTKGIRGRNI